MASKSADDLPVPDDAATNPPDSPMILDAPAADWTRLDFSMEESVLAKDSSSGVYYPAVIRQARYTDQQWTFLVHYAGWNVRFDEWLTAQDLLKDTPENRQLAQAQQATPKPPAEQDTNAPPRKRSKTTSTDGRTAKRRSSNATGTTPLLYQEYCELPITLKTVLVEEWETLTRRGYDHVYATEILQKPARKLHTLPAAVTIRQVIQHFEKKKIQQIVKEQKKQEATAKEGEDQVATADETAVNSSQPSAPVDPQLVRDFCQGLLKLFQDALPVCLLYPQERPQYDALQQDPSLADKDLADIYGCEYLLRLFVRLPVLLQASSKTFSNNDTTAHLGPWLYELLVLLQKNRHACFKASYREPRASEWLDWEKRLYCRNTASSTTVATPTTDKNNTKAAVAMDTK